MVRIATRVNEDFYSADTVPYIKRSFFTGATTIEYKYPQPTLEGLTPDSEGHYYYPGTGALVQESDSPLFADPTSVFYLDEKVLNAQRSVLIPTAIRASAEVLDRFLPRFETRLTVEKLYPRSPDDDQYIVHSTLRQVRANPDAWSGYDDLIVRNGAYLVVTPRDEKKTEQQLSHFSDPILVDATKDQNFNDWVNVYKFKPGTTVQMKYDLGGYVIKSNEVTIPELPTTTPTRPMTAPTTTETTAIVTNPTTFVGEGPACGLDGYCQGCCYWFMDEDPDINKAVCTPPWEEDAGVDVGDKYSNGCWMLRPTCNCKTGEDLDPSAVDTNIWSSLPDEYKNSEGGDGESPPIREHSGESGTFY